MKLELDKEYLFSDLTKDGIKYIKVRYAAQKIVGKQHRFYPTDSSSLIRHIDVEDQSVNLAIKELEKE